MINWDNYWNLVSYAADLAHKLAMTKIKPMGLAIHEAARLFRVKRAHVARTVRSKGYDAA